MLLVANIYLSMKRISVVVSAALIQEIKDYINEFDMYDYQPILIRLRIRNIYELNEIESEFVYQEWKREYMNF